MKYNISTEDYLERARQQLDSGIVAGIFYAAFELRCGIESRMYRYLEARENITKLKRRGWKIAKMASQIESTFKTKGKICVMSFENECIPISELKYIPISGKLKKMADRLGDYLHALKEYRSDDDLWWAETRSYMESVYEELSFIATGTLMGAPLKDPKTNTMHLEIELPRKDEHKMSVLMASFKENDSFKARIEYYDREKT